jgi:hypothetical protein
LQIINGANDPESVLTNVTLPFTIDTAGPIAIARARNQLYIPNGASNNIAVVDGRNGRTIKVFALEPKFGLVDQVRGVAIDESRSRVYAVARTRGGSCCLYAISDGIQTAISIPAEAAGPVLSPALNKLYLWIVPLPAANPP